MRLLAMVVFCASLDAQFVVSDLARLRNYDSERVSSYDRSGGNRDYTKLKPGQTLSLFDENGPGEIRHMWITKPTGEAFHLKRICCKRLKSFW